MWPGWEHLWRALICRLGFFHITHKKRNILRIAYYSKSYINLRKVRGQETFFWKGEIVIFLGFVGYTISVAVIQLCQCNRNTSMDDIEMDGHDCSVKRNSPEQETRWLGNTGGGLLTSEVSPFGLTFLEIFLIFFFFCTLFIFSFSFQTRSSLGLQPLMARQ